MATGIRETMITVETLGKHLASLRPDTYLAVIDRVLATLDDAQRESLVAYVDHVKACHDETCDCA